MAGTLLLAAQLAVAAPLASSPPAAPVASPAVYPAPAPEPADMTAPVAAPDNKVADKVGPEAAADVIVVTGKTGAPPGDPAEAVNEVSFKAVQGVDKALVGPLAKGYEKAVPSPVRQGVRNALNNLAEPINFLNYLLQLKPGKALGSFGRFAINSTVGVAGLVDVAKRKPFNIQFRRNGFANTLGYYGVGHGPYMFLPLIGPTSVRDLTGRLLDLSLLPGVAGKPFNSPVYSLTTGSLRSLEDRVEFDETIRLLREECVNAYASQRQWYMAMRAADIAELKGKPIDVMALMPDCLKPEEAFVPPASVPVETAPSEAAPAAPPQEAATAPTM